MARLWIELLGAPRAEVDGRPLSVDTRKAIALLAYLAVTAQAHSRDSLCALLWPEYDEESARASLRRTLSALKKGLGPVNDRMIASRDQVGLQSSADIALDVTLFTSAIWETENHGHSSDGVCLDCLQPLSVAAQLYRGDFMAGFTLRDCPDFEDWQRFQTESLKRALGRVLERLTGGAAGIGRLDDALAAAQRRLALDPLHEPAHRQLMLAYAWADQKAAALRQYRSCVRILDEELGVAPLPETTQLAELIRENHTPSPPSIAEPSAHAAQRSPSPASTTAPDYPLVGRAQEWEALTSAYAQVHDGGRLVVLEGEAGIGKTRLAESFLADLSSRGAAVMPCRCYEGESSLAYGPISDGLRAALTHKHSTEQLQAISDQVLGEAALLIPELTAARPGLPPPISDIANAGARLVEALRRLLVALLGGDTPGVLFVDDLHWADESTLQLLGSIVRRLREEPLVVLVTWRSDEVPAWHPLQQLLANARRAGVATTLTLSRLRPNDVADLVRARIASADIPAELAPTLYRVTEGVPILLNAYLELYDSGTPPGDVVPASIRDLLHARLIGLSELARQVLATAATVGHSFYFDIVRDAGGRSEDETVAALEELLARHLVREVEAEHGPLRFDFMHDQIRQVVYEDMSLVRRRLLHRRIAETLVRGGLTRFHSHLAQIATHYQLAGQHDVAADYFCQAGDHARTLHANAEALAHYQAALALGHADAAYLHEAEGDLLTLTGSYSAAITSYDLAAARASATAPAPVERKLANIYARQGAWDLAESHFQAALEASAEADYGERARILAAWCLMAYRRGQPDRAAAMAGQALDAARAANDSQILAECYNIMGLIARHQGTLTEAAGHLQCSLELANSAGDLAIRVAALNNLALTYATSGQAEPGLELLDSALRLCRSLGDRHHEAALLTNMADLLRATGNTEAAVERLKEAVPILAEVGAASGALQPEIWKLADW